MRVAVLYDDISERPAAATDVAAVLQSVEAVEAALRELGHAPVRVPVPPILDGWPARLARANPDVVFNLCEGAGRESADEAKVAGAVELLGLPMTGSGAETLALARRKDRVNALLGAADIPVPAWTLVKEEDGVPEWERFPAIVKPAGEDASYGISQKSVAENEQALAAALDATALRPVIIQEFLSGPELAVGFVGETVLPISEILFRTRPEVPWPIVSYRAKWDEGSPEDLCTVPRCPARLDRRTRERATEIARAAWQLVEGRGYGRVDLRADDAGELHVLDVNPNADISPNAGLTRMAAALGWSYTQLVGRIVEEAVR